MTRRRPAIFLDRDGVIIENVDSYVRTWADVQFLPGVFDALRRLAAAPYAVVLVTNQSAVGRGMLTAELAFEINARVLAEVAAHGGRIDAAYLCPHSPADDCTCRKPEPGMLLEAQDDLELNLADSFLVGDAVSDLGAAEAAGVRGILVKTGRGAQQAATLDHAGKRRYTIVDDLAAALDQILSGVSHN